MTTGASTETRGGASVGGAYDSVNGLKMYYETHGAGKSGTPLVLLHGAFGTVSMFASVLPGLAESRPVIGVELQAHGHTADIDRPITFEQMADDVAALVEHLGLEKVDIFGYSLGGGVALQTAIRRPDLVRKLALLSAVCKSDGWYPETRAGMASISPEVAQAWVGSPMHAAYAASAPDPDNWPRFVGKIGDLLRKNYDWSDGVAALSAPALIVVGDADGVRLTHAAEMFGLLGGGKGDGMMSGVSSSQLAVLPGTNHIAALERGDLLLSIIPPFLDASVPEAGAEQ